MERATITGSARSWYLVAVLAIPLALALATNGSWWGTVIPSDGAATRSSSSDADAAGLADVGVATDDQQLARADDPSGVEATARRSVEGTQSELGSIRFVLEQAQSELGPLPSDVWMPVLLHRPDGDRNEIVRVRARSRDLASFSGERIRAGTWHYETASGGFGTVEVVVGDELEVPIAIQGLARIGGRVVRPGGGGAPGARVEVGHAESPPLITLDVNQTDGSFEFWWCGDRCYATASLGEGLVSPTYHVLVPRVFDAQDLHDLGDLELAPCCALHITVGSSVRGGPLEGATVEFGSAARGSKLHPNWSTIPTRTTRLRSAVTDSLGAAELTGLPLGDCHLTLRAPDHASITFDWAIERELEQVSTNLGPGATRRGTVRDDGGEVVPNARVTLSHQLGTIDSVLVGHDGRFELHGIGSSDYVVRVVAPGHVDVKLELARTKVDEVMEVSEIDIVLERLLFHRVDGSVDLSAVDDRSRLRVRFYGEALDRREALALGEATIDADGRFKKDVRVSPIPEGVLRSYAVLEERGDEVSQRVDLGHLAPGGSSTIVLELDRR